jgi:hypothetical protein
VVYRVLTLGMRRDIRNGEVPMKKLNRSRDQVLNELRNAYEGGASIRTLVATTGRSYGSIHSMLRESGTTMRSRGGPNHRSRRAS